MSVEPDQSQTFQRMRHATFKKRVLKVAVLGAIVLAFFWFGWPFLQLIRTGKKTQPQSLTTTIREIVTQPRAAILGTSFNIQTITAQGLRGDKGDNGNQGPKGDKGDSGSAGSNGAGGQNGGAAGTDVPGVLLPVSSPLPGPKGDKGDTGAAGSNGAKGDKGDAGSGSLAFVQNGNTFGTTALLGTNDNTGLAFETNSVQRVLLDTLGNFKINGGKLMVNGPAAFGNVTGALDPGGADPTQSLTNNMMTVLATGANAATGANGSYTMLRLAGEYTPAAGPGIHFFNGNRISLTANPGDGSSMNLMRGVYSFLVNNSLGDVAESESFKGYVQNNGTTSSRLGTFENTFENNGIMTGGDTRTAEFHFINNVGKTAPEHYGFISETKNSGTMLGSMTGFSAFVTNKVGATTDSLRGYRSYIHNDGTSNNEVIGIGAGVTNTGTAHSNLVGLSVLAVNSGTVDQNIYGIRIENHDLSPSATGSEYGISVPVSDRGTINNYGLYLGGATGGSGTAAALWINSGLARFAPTNGSQASVRLASSGGTDVSSPGSGDLWWNGTRLYFNNGSSNIDLLASVGSTFLQNGNTFGTTAVLGTTDTQDLTFLTNASERIRILADGKVGIGLTNPDQALVVNGNIKTIGNTLGIMLDGQDRPLITRGWDPFTSGNYAGAGSWGVFMEPNILTFGTLTGANHSFQFARYNTDSTVAQTDLFINDQGNVGIGSGQSAEARLGVGGDFGSYNSVGSVIRGEGNNGSVLSIVQSGVNAWGIGMDPSNTSLSFIQNRYVGNAGVEMMTLDINGNLGIGVPTPAARLDVLDNRSGGYAAKIINDGNSADRFGLLVRSGEDDSGLSTNRLVTFQNQSGTEVGSIEYNGGTTFYNTSSDSRAKTDIIPTTLTLNDLMNIKLYDYHWKMQPDGGKNYGVLAQELYDIFPQAVSKPTDTNRLWAVDYSKLVPLTIKGIQDQQLEIRTLKTQLGQLSQVAQWNYTAWTFMGEVTFAAKAKFLAAADFFGQVTFHDRVTFMDKDLAGRVVIPAGQTSIALTFAQSYLVTPVVTATANGQVLALAVDQVTAQGFVVKIASPLAEQLTVSWMAIAVNSATIVPSASPVVTITPQPSVMPSSTLVPTPSPDPSVIPSVTPSASPGVSPAPSPSVAPSLSPSPTPLASVIPSPDPAASPTSSPTP